jgi:uncharacterized damage-inducible protein DinB
MHLDYSAWASGRLLEAAAGLSDEELNRDFQTADRGVLGTLVHVFVADRVWLARLSGAKPEYTTDADRSLPVLHKQWPALHQRWAEWAARLSGDLVLEEIAYVDMKGRPWKQPLWQLVLHVVNHATHHRGQVSGFLRSMGHAPPQIDLVLYYRELQAAHVTQAARG